MLHTLLFALFAISVATAADKIPQCDCFLEDQKSDGVNFETLKKMEALNQELKTLGDEMITEIVIIADDARKLQEIRNFLKEQLPNHTEYELKDWTRFEAVTIRVKKKDVSQKVIEGLREITDVYPQVRPADTTQRAIVY